MNQEIVYQIDNLDNIRPPVDSRRFLEDVREIVMHMDQERLDRLTNYIHRVEDINVRAPFSMIRRREGPSALGLAIEAICRTRRFYIIQYELVSLLLQYGADPNLPWDGLVIDQQNALRLVVDTYRRGSTFLYRYVRLLVRFGADPYQETELGSAMSLIQNSVPVLLEIVEPVRSVLIGVERRPDSVSRFSNLPREMRNLVAEFLIDRSEESSEEEEDY